MTTSRRILLRDRSIDLHTGEVWMHDGTPGRGLSQKERSCLSYLAERESRTVTHQQLLTDVWGYQEGTNSRTVFSTIHRLRTKIEAVASEPKHLLADFGDGYRFVLVPMTEWVSDEDSELAGLAVFASAFTEAEAREVLPDARDLASQLEAMFGQPQPNSVGMAFPPLPEAERRVLRSQGVESLRGRSQKAWETLREGQIARLLNSPDDSAARHRLLELEADVAQLTGSDQPAHAVTAVEALAVISMHRGVGQYVDLAAKVAESQKGPLKLRALVAAGGMAVRFEALLAIRLLRQAQELAERFGTPAERSAALDALGRAYAAAGDYSNALKAFEASPSTLERRPDIRHWHNLALIRCGRVPEALEISKWQFDLARTSGSDVVNAGFQLSWALSSAGRYAEAYEVAKTSYMDSILAASPYLSGRVAVYWTVTAAQLGRWSEVDALLMENRRRLAEPRTIQVLNRAQATIAAARGQWGPLSLLFARPELLNYSPHEDGAPAAAVQAIARLAASDLEGARRLLAPHANGETTGAVLCAWMAHLCAHVNGETKPPPKTEPAEASVQELITLWNALRDGLPAPEVHDLTARGVRRRLRLWVPGPGTAAPNRRCRQHRIGLRPRRRCRPHRFRPRRTSLGLRRRCRRCRWYRFRPRHTELERRYRCLRGRNRPPAPSRGAGLPM